MEVLQRTANRGSVSTASYEIDNSLKFEPDNSEYIYRTPSSAGNRKTWTLSFWLKRTELGASMRIFEAWDGSTGTSALFTDADLFILDLNAGSNYFTSSAVFRDTSAWYHFVIRVDTTQGTASERARVYVNGSELAGSWNSNIGQNTDLTWNQNVAHNFARFHNGDSYVSGYYAEIINVDGTSLAPTAFGEVDSASGIWKPIDASPTYGTNGFKLEFKTAGGLGADTSGNGHTWSLNAIAAADQATDTPTNNFCTMNMLDRTNGNSKTQEGATKVTTDGGSGWCSMVATMGVTKGKWYWETQRSGGSSDSNDVVVGIVGDSDAYIPYSSAAQYYIGNVAEQSSMGFYTTAAPNVRNGSGDSLSNSAGDIIMIGLDMDNSKLYFGINGTWDALGTGGSTIWSSFDNQFVLPAVSVYQGKQIKINFGGYASYTISSANSDADGYGTFEYAPPSGYYALCTKNLAEFG